MASKKESYCFSQKAASVKVPKTANIPNAGTTSTTTTEVNPQPGKLQTRRILIHN